jgi:polysaccharide pyruvyl transferase WcaK-like protein
MKPLTLEIHGTGTHNRGAELMAIAIAERMRATFPGVKIVVPQTFGNSEDRCRHGFLTTWDCPGSGAKEIRVGRGTIDPAEVDVVLDASGFAFSDQWGSWQAKALCDKMNRPERQKQRLILLPQALGPFEQPEVAAATRMLLSRADLVCARDDYSFAAANKLGGARRLLQFPDFTLAVRPITLENIKIPERFAAIVPNYRMMDMTVSADSYLAFLKVAIAQVRHHGLNPGFVLHDAVEDRRVIERLQETRPLKILTDSDPRVLKGILGNAELVIGSRFHALVSAMSQGVPCLGAGWSHKYPELFRDFNARTLLLSDLTDQTTLCNRIAELADPAIRASHSTRISAATKQLKVKIEGLWSEIENIILSSSSQL